MLMAAGYTVKEIMGFLGHAGYIKFLPQRDERNCFASGSGRLQYGKS